MANYRHSKYQTFIEALNHTNDFSLVVVVFVKFFSLVLWSMK